MKTGDLIKFKLTENSVDDRSLGVLIEFDTYVGSMGAEDLSRVLWNTGETGWILSERIEVINEHS